MAASAVRELLIRISYELNRGSQHRAEAAINGTKANMRRMAQSATFAGDSLSRAFLRAGPASQMAARAVNNVNYALARLRRNSNVNLNLKGFSQGLGTVNNQASALIGKFNLLATAIAGAFATSAIIDTADEMMNLDGRLRTLYDDERERAAVENQLYTMSQKNRQGLSDIGDLYFKVASSVEQYGMGAAEAARLTDIVSKSLTVGGASAEQASATILQLGQALGSGQLQGDELSSLRENAFTLMQQMSKSLGVTVGDLKEMGAQGELTSEVVINAILASGDAIDAQFKKMPTTIGQAMKKSSNLWRRFVWYIENRSKVFSQLGQQISDVVDKGDALLTIMSGPIEGRTPEETARNKIEYEQTVAENPALAQVAAGLNKIVEALGIAGQYINDIFTPAIDAIKEHWEPIMQAFEPGLQMLKQGVDEWKEAFETLKPVLQGIATILGYALVGAITSLFTIGSRVFRDLGDLINTVASAVRTLYDWLSAVVNKVLEFIGLKAQFDAAGSAAESFSRQIISTNIHQDNQYNLTDSSQLGDAVQSAYDGLPGFMPGF
ncbi:tape measure protein [Megasphaera stantonii]|uniref:Tape measure protein N-terminal domain-containing protein n=1 Tax=Megasphaera stantonii TaxID=2144175 RepID=A0A346B175_9FIRM|nr:tape measure protein [Megasphaera stantonii]AXL21868.1 hypothetical protein DKB62_10000 [Megasphaera stantonii]